MKKEFPGHFANRADDIEKLWADCLFVLDANVLLSLYRYSDSTRAELLEVFEKLRHRLWIPHQVAHEYLANRLGVIAEQVKVYDDAVKRVEALRRLIDSKSQHPFVSSELLASVDTLFDKLVLEFRCNQKAHEGRVNSDEIKDRLELLLEGNVGSGYDKDTMESIMSAGKLRYDEKIPPGYEDIKKGGDSLLFIDRCRRYGDYIVWLQIIEQAKKSSRSVVFITGDVKEDWWVSALGKIVGPQPQLVDEFVSATGHSFYMYAPDRFLERAGSFLKHAPTEQSLKEIREFGTDDLAASALHDAVMDAWPNLPQDSGMLNQAAINAALHGRWYKHEGSDGEGITWVKMPDDPRVPKNILHRKRSVKTQLAKALVRKGELTRVQESLKAGLYSLSGESFEEFSHKVQENLDSIDELKLELAWLAKHSEI